jgi:hypothetical protein
MSVIKILHLQPFFFLQKFLHLQPLHLKLGVGVRSDALHVALLRWTFSFLAHGAHAPVVSAPNCEAV